MKIKIKTNFDFGKLSNNMPNIISDYLSGYAKGTEIGSKQNIDNGLEDIKESTKEWRRSKGYPEFPPLKASGKMYNSIKSNKNKLNMMDYGVWHDRGEVPTTKARPFIGSTPENEKIIDDKFAKSIDNFLSK